MDQVIVIAWGFIQFLLCPLFFFSRFSFFIFFSFFFSFQNETLLSNQKTLKE